MYHIEFIIRNFTIGKFQAQMCTWAPREMCRNVYSIIIYNSLKLETARMSINRKMDKYITAQSHNGPLQRRPGPHGLFHTISASHMPAGRTSAQQSINHSYQALQATWGFSSLQQPQKGAAPLVSLLGRAQRGKRRPGGDPGLLTPAPAPYILNLSS